MQDDNGRGGSAREADSLRELWEHSRQEWAQVVAEGRRPRGGGSGSDGGVGNSDGWDDESREEYAKWSDDVNRQHESEADEAWATEALERMQREDDERVRDK